MESLDRFLHARVLSVQHGRSLVGQTRLLDQPDLHNFTASAELLAELLLSDFNCQELNEDSVVVGVLDVFADTGETGLPLREVLLAGNEALNKDNFAVRLLMLVQVLNRLKGIFVLFEVHICDTGGGTLKHTGINFSEGRKHRLHLITGEAFVEAGDVQIGEPLLDGPGLRALILLLENVDFEYVAPTLLLMKFADGFVRFRRCLVLNVGKTAARLVRVDLELA